MSAADLTFDELLSELYARGADFLSTDSSGQTRAKRFLNQSYLEIVEMERWPFREASASGAAPLTISDLGEIESVRVSNESNRRLEGKSRRLNTLDLTTTGSPAHYYVTTGNVVTTYPIGGTLQVSYWKIPAELSAPTDTPILPNRFRYLIVTGAMRYVYLDSDEVSLAEAMRQELLGGVDLMRQSLGAQAEQDRILVVDGGEW